MAEISRVALFSKLNPLAYRAIESGTVFCKLRGNPYVELVHWLHQILLAQDSDLQRVITHFELDQGALARDIALALDRLPRGSTSISDISAQVDEAVERGWVFGSLMFGSTQVRTGHLLVGMLRTSNLRNALFAISRQVEKIRLDTLTERFAVLLDGSPEAGMAATAPGVGTRHDGAATTAEGSGSGALPAAALGRQEALRRYTVDLTEQARSGKLDPVVGRDDEIRQVIDILMRRRQNNPILTGEAGVGKTAVVEGFAQRIVAGDVPPALRDAMVCTLDVGLLQAGASMKGEFENRLRQVIEEVQASARPVILFIDEAHTLVGAGGAAGTGDAANLLKPALARGTLRTIAATTWSEYKKHIEKDPALTRRFQVVQVPEPSEECAIRMMRGIVRQMQQHHGVLVLDEALEAAVTLSHRYIPARQLPDKAVSLLDTACARVAVSQHAVPPAVEDARRRIDAWQTEAGIIARESALGMDTAGRAADIAAKLDAERTRLAQLIANWEGERELVTRILALRCELEEDASTDTAGDHRVAELQALQRELARRQGDQPLILPGVDRHAVAAVVQDWTGIPVGRMVRDDLANVLKLADTLNQRIVGQAHAMEMIARRVQTSRAGLDNPHKPIGVFMLAGTSGVGKTETALALAEALYGGEQNVITVNMSEYQEAHTVSSLKGAPPGYVGYGEGGVLTEAVRRRPYSVVLLDEFEKAHPDVHELFFQVFDKGRMEDGEGRQIDFRNTLILLTTNVGTELITRLCGNPDSTPSPEQIARALRAPLVEVFPPALLGRVAVIPYYPLDDAMLDAIIRLQLSRIERRIVEQHGVSFNYDDAMVRQIAARCTEFESGGRMIDAILTNTLLPRISAEFLTRLIDGRTVAKVEVGASDGEFTYAFD
ncbi:type VI secretion system ATPase TssH [Paraburkholderia panacisoli]|uniref:Type VI secretion system ATPase TssH n=1 Tax=Paraburkholderia panacisoli TaxID=2603818 RepID=A0A5B0GEC6_9BURK|nr:type VI secretion system ATPase TssH [Paraburkholderia panacisoli]KAA1000981.1 type VI secretion system ATPase TssH [Paraburkholderia panacisoli]